MQSRLVDWLRFALRVVGVAAAVSLFVLLIALFWPSIFMFAALYGFSKRITPKLDREEEFGAVIVVFLVSFIWWLGIGHATIFLI